MEDNSKDKFRDSIGDLLSELPDEVPGLDDTPELPKVRSENTQAVALTKAKSKAKKVMSSLLKFYLSEEIIAEHEYIQAKSNLDEYALGMLIRQMENSEIAISSLMDIINEGDVSPRMFEVLSDLQRTLLDIIYHSNSESSNNKKQSGVKSRGTKDLMRALQETINEEDIQDVDSDENEE